MKQGIYKVLDAALRHTDILEHLDLHRRKSISQIMNCHEGRLGGAIQVCDDCGKHSIIAHSCRNRSCPRCQINASLQWLEKQRGCVLNTRYFHMVFTLPHSLNPVIRQNRRQCLGGLFDALSQTLSSFAANNLRAKIGVTAILHTWGQSLCEHYHVHCIVTAGGIAVDSQNWVDVQGKRMFDVRALSLVFRAKYLSALEKLYKADQLEFHGKTRQFESAHEFKTLLICAARKNWVVYSKLPFAGPDQVLKYLSLYTHRVGISDNRILNIDESNLRVRIAYKDYAHSGKKKKLWLDLDEFVRRFSLHILPSGFVKIRHYALLCNRYRRANLQIARNLIAQIRSLKTTDTKPEREPIKVPCCPWCGSPAIGLVDRRKGYTPLPAVMYLIPDTS